MSTDVLEQIRQISQGLYNIVVKTAKGKWDPVSVEKKSVDIYIVNLVNNKKPEKTDRYKCFFNGQRWFIV
jgi:hypothetical protein